MDVVGMRTYTVVVAMQKEKCMLEDLASKRGYDGFSS